MTGQGATRFVNSPSNADWRDLASVTVVRGGALGDFLVTLPALRAARRPERRLRFIGHATAARALAPDLFDDVQPIDDPTWAWVFADGVAPPRGDGGAVVMLRDRDAARRLARAGWSPVLTVHPHPPADSRLSVAEHLIEALAPLGVLSAEPRSQTVSIEPFRSHRSYAVVHPGSGSRQKNWPPQRFAALLDRMDDLEPVLVTGPADEAPVAALLEHLRRPIQVRRAVVLRELAALIAGADLYVGNDSGVTHLAAAVGAPTVAIFGPTRALRWRPWGQRIATVEPDGRCPLCEVAEERPAPCDCIERVSVEAVESAAQRVRA